ncbi:DNA/RNA non-specific endonuclease [Deinococcus sp. SL84]|uniref:DNA/RNA non-specific endonuclease n=1 Tax=Deinococcus sp. SL84 TaxID=2994663 RepID=UPI0022723491|nr:DNA/RNA non-specific endonuclease [Deinococcus sp. SL84]MCY1703853.1 DNA/RNA non-specific endonuclease [Deinococcus sp. SL84]
MRSSVLLLLTGTALLLAPSAQGQSGCLQTPVRLTDTYKGEKLHALCTADMQVRYSLTDRIPRLVAEVLTPAKLNGTVPREDNFRADERLPLDARADINDYRGSGYDRGHLAPAADFKYSATAMDNSFLLSNIAPQEPTMNQAAWNGLEDATRACVKQAGSLTVLTGTLGKSGSLNGRGRVTIPSSFFKMWTNGTDYRLWVLPNIAVGKLSGAQYGQYEVSIKDLQSFWPEFSVGLPLNAAAPGKLCPGVIPLKRVQASAQTQPGAAPRPATAPAPAPRPRPATPAPAPSNVYYANCSAARAAGAAPLRRGQPGYRPAMDRDGDGVACE